MKEQSWKILPWQLDLWFVTYFCRQNGQWISGSKENRIKRQCSTKIGHICGNASNMHGSQVLLSTVFKQPKPWLILGVLISADMRPYIENTGFKHMSSVWAQLQRVFTCAIRSFVPNLNKWAHAALIGELSFFLKYQYLSDLNVTVRLFNVFPNIYFLHYPWPQKHKCLLLQPFKNIFWLLLCI